MMVVVRKLHLEVRQQFQHLVLQLQRQGRQNGSITAHICAPSIQMVLRAPPLPTSPKWTETKTTLHVKDN